MLAPIGLTPGRVTPIHIHGERTGFIAATELSGVEHFTVDWQVNTAAEELPLLWGAGPQRDLPAGTYRITVRDTDNPERLVSHTYTVRENRPIKIFPGAVTDILVCGAADGVIGTSMVTGGNGQYNVYWQSFTPTIITGHTLREKKGLLAGRYLLTITDGVGAQAVHEFVIEQTPQLTIRAGRTKNAALWGSSAGSISECSIQGGLPPYTFAWSNNEGQRISVPVDQPKNRYDLHTTSTKNDLPPGKYTLYVQDTVGATAQHVFLIREGPEQIYFNFGASHNLHRLT